MLNRKAYDHARGLVERGQVERSASWSFDAADGNRILGDPPDWDAYARWFLLKDPDADAETKDAYKYPYGKNGKVYRSALTAIRQRAAQQNEEAIFDAAGRLLQAIDRTEAKRFVALSREIGGAAPEWFQVLPAGTVRLEDEEDIFVTDEGAAAIIAHFKSLGHDMVIDYEHQTLYGGEAPAAGWIKQLDWRGQEGLWARAEWTDKAREYIARREYRYFSPVPYFRKGDRVVVQLYNVALTNQPRMMDAQALAAKLKIREEERSDQMDQMIERIKKILNMPHDAAEDSVVKAVDQLAAKNKSLEQGAKKAGEIVACKEVLEALGAKDGDDAEAVIARIDGLRKDRSGLEVQFAALKKDHEDLKAKWSAKVGEELISQALKDGQISPAQVDEWGRKMATDEPDAFKRLVLSRRKYSEVPLKELPEGDEDAGGAPAEQMQRLIAKKMKESKDLSYADAMNLVAKEHPDLTEQYLEAGRVKH